jgi:capsular polysaccharide biosynthesis protein
MIPQDVDIIGSSEQKLKVRNKKPTYYFEIVIGFEGVNVGVWSHFLIESFPKLLYLDSFLETDKMYVLILPVGIDEQILEIVKLFTEKYNNIELCFLPSNICFSARVYYYIPKISFIMDHSVVSSYGDIIIPTYTKNALLALKMKCLQIYTEPRLSKPKSRIYIPRRGKRGITNSSELETMFLEFGFEIIEPTLLTLKEKVLIFSECEIIAGGLGSGLSNLVFSKNQVKLIVFNNIYRIDDTYLGYLCDLFNVELLHLACPTLMSSLDAPIYVEIDKVKKQIKSFLSV